MQTPLVCPVCVLSQSARCSSWPPTPYQERFIKVKRWFPCLMWRKACVCSSPIGLLAVGPCLIAVLCLPAE